MVVQAALLDEWYVGIELPDFPLDHLDHPVGRERRPGHHGGRGIVLLQSGPEYNRFWAVAQRNILAVFGDSDDFDPVSVAGALAESLADGILVRKDSPGKRLVHNGDEFRTLGIVRIEVAAGY